MSILTTQPEQNATMQQQPPRSRRVAREFDVRWPRTSATLAGNRQVDVVCERYARREIHEATFRHLRAVLTHLVGEGSTG